VHYSDSVKISRNEILCGLLFFTPDSGRRNGESKAFNPEDDKSCPVNWLFKL